MAHPSPTTLHSNDWLDLVDAAEHADVPYREIVRAVTDRELTAITTHPRRPGDWLVREADVDAWRSGYPSSSAMVSG